MSQKNYTPLEPSFVKKLWVQKVDKDENCDHIIKRKHNLPPYEIC